MHKREAWRLPLLPCPVDVRLLSAILDSVSEKSETDPTQHYTIARNIERSLAYLCCAVETGFISEVDTTIASYDYSVRVYIPSKISDNS